jgi:hypothetical protein
MIQQIFEWLRELVEDKLGSVLINALIFPFVLSLISILISHVQRPRMGVAYTVISRKKQLDEEEKKQLQGKLTVFYNDILVKSVTILKLKVWNSGSLPIRPIDYECPISFSMGQYSQVLSIDSIEVDPPELAIGIKGENTHLVIIEPKLLNPQDTITFNVFVKDVENRIYPAARIAGVKQILRVRQKIYQFFVFIVLLFLGVAFVVLGGYLTPVPRPPAPSTSISNLSYLVGLIFMLVGAILYLWACVYGLNISSKFIPRFKQRLRGGTNVHAAERD